MFGTAQARKANFQSDEKGTVAVLFGLAGLMLIGFTGLALDIGRTTQSNSALGQAMDAAALAAVKGFRIEGLSDAEAETLATNVLQQNMAHSGGHWTNIKSVNVQINRGQSSATIGVDAGVKTMFAGVLGVTEMPLAKTATAVFDIRDIEVGVQLDLTGSMCQPCTKISALRTATADLIDILLPDGGTTNKVRVALAPFAQTLNAGALAPVVSNNTSTGCVYESNAFNPNTDTAPSAVKYLQNAGNCPSSSSGKKLPAVVPLTDDKTLLKNEVANYETYGGTAGHLGTSWAWYMLSPNWSSLLPTASQPVAYNDNKTSKVAILMTDGVYNTVHGVDQGDVSATAVDSQTRAKAMCDGMKAQGITVYTVGFDLTVYQATEPVAYADAIATLKYCASSPDKYYPANSSAELTNAFHTIAAHIVSLRVTQ